MEFHNVLFIFLAVLACLEISLDFFFLIQHNCSYAKHACFQNLGQYQVIILKKKGLGQCHSLIFLIHHIVGMFLNI